MTNRPSGSGSGLITETTCASFLSFTVICLSPLLVYYGFATKRELSKSQNLKKKLSESRDLIL